MHKSKKREMVTDDEIKKAFLHTNYGPDPDYRYIIKWGLMKVVADYAIGYTTKTILQELGLLEKSKTNPSLTQRGRHCVWEFFKDGYRH